MKRNASQLLICSMVLGAAFACTPENPDGNPLYDAKTKEVTTQFVISVNTGQDASTKQSAVNVQKAGNFLGMQDGEILLFKSYDGNNALPALIDPSKTSDKHYKFGTLYVANSEINNETTSNRVLQLSVPVGINNAVIYGKAINPNPGCAQGKMTTVMSDTPENISFSLCPRIEDTEAYAQTEDLMIKCINVILGSHINALGTTESYKGYTALDTLSWRGLGHQYRINKGLETATTAHPVKSLTALEEIVGRAYSDFISIKTGEYRAGCAAAIRRMVSDMYTVMDKAASAIPTGPEEANAMRLVEKIEGNTLLFYNHNTDSGVWEYKEKSQIKEKMASAGIMTETDFDTAFAKAVSSLNNFPTAAPFHIPEGAAQLEYTAKNEAGTEATYNALSYKRPNQALLRDDGGSFDPTRYAYPPEIAYYVNSPLLVTNKEVTTASFPNGAGNWETSTLWTNNTYGWESYENGAVSSSTRGIAVKNNIHYGVALLKTSVALADGPFIDNRHECTGEDNQSINKSNINFVLTGILVGGQNGQMNWQYLRKNQAASGGTTYSNNNNLAYFNWVVFDDEVEQKTIPTPANKFNYTVVFDNYDSSLPDNAQGNANVALEFQNLGDTFYGKHGACVNNGKFYLLGKLTVSNPSSSTIAWSDNYQVPPTYLDASTLPSGKKLGDSRRVPRIFIQGYETVVRFTIGSESLKKAYNTIPDLRSAQMSLGLSVDLEWKSGFVYDITF